MTVEQEAATNGQGGGQNSDNQEQGGAGAAGAKLNGDSLLTRPDGEGGDKGAAAVGRGTSLTDGDSRDRDGQDAGKDNGGDAGKVPDKPEAYDLKFGKDTPVDKELLGDFQNAAHELGLSQGKAQKLASLYEAHAAKAGERAAEAQRQAIESAKTKWEDEIEKRPNFGQERDHARAALRQYGTRELYELMDQTNIGSHPEMWGFLANIGKALAEPGFHGSNSNKETSAADVLYPNQGK